MEFKEKLLKLCVEIAEQKVKEIQQSLNELNNSVGSESKSSAGDKHETGRAMMHLEQEQIGEQLKQAEAVLQQVLKINIQYTPNKIALGTVVKTNKSNFFIAAALGKISLGQKDYLILSPKAPLCAAMMGLKKGDTFKFNGVQYNIEELI